MKLSIREYMVPGATLAEKVRKLAQYGFDGIEITGTPDIKEKAASIRELVAGSPVKISAICSGVRGCLLDSRKSERDMALSDLKMFLEAAAEVGATGVIYAPLIAIKMQIGGPRSRVPDLSPLIGIKQTEEKMFVEYTGDLGRHAARFGVFFLIEPLNRYETFWLCRLDEGVEICRAAGTPGAKVMADFFHMSIEEDDIAASILKAGDLIQHVHLADSNRQQPGTGHTDFRGGFAVLKKIGFDKYGTLECGVRGKPDEALPQCAALIRRMWNDA